MTRDDFSAIKLALESKLDVAGKETPESVKLRKAALRILDQYTGAAEVFNAEIVALVTSKIDRMSDLSEMDNADKLVSEFVNEYDQLADKYYQTCSSAPSKRSAKLGGSSS